MAEHVGDPHDVPSGCLECETHLEVDTARVQRLASSWGQVTVGDVFARLLAPVMQSSSAPLRTWQEGSSTLAVLVGEDVGDGLDLRTIPALVEDELRSCEGAAQAQFERLSGVPRVAGSTVDRAAS